MIIHVKSCDDDPNSFSGKLIANRNDFLLGPDDAAWLKSTFRGKKLTIFPNGGHLGNLSSPPMRAAILESLKGLR